jgi:hypothetical protein
MKALSLICLILFGSIVSCAGEAKIPASLRGGIKADQSNINIALKMQKQGWAYTMPKPKSNQASWGNSDGRTTWWKGFWNNKTTKRYSSTTPKLKDGKYIGDGINSRGWRRGGSPRTPTKLEWLLSKSGGIVPR